MPNASENCTTCGDTAVAMLILQRDGDDAVCADGDGKRCAVRLDFVPCARTGESVLVHFGVALARVGTKA